MQFLLLKLIAFAASGVICRLNRFVGGKIAGSLHRIVNAFQHPVVIGIFYAIGNSSQNQKQGNKLHCFILSVNK